MEIWRNYQPENKECLSKFKTKHDKIKSIHDTPAKPDMACQLKRTSTFQNYPGMGVELFSVILLVSSGLFYTGDGNELQCYMCGVLIKDCVNEDDVYNKHRKLSCNCKMVKNNILLKQHFNEQENNLSGDFKTGNLLENQDLQDRNYDHIDNDITNLVKSSGQVHITDNNGAVQLVNGHLGIVNDVDTILERRNTSPHLRNCDYTIFSNRVSSFLGNWSNNLPITVQDLCNAGLYYTGPGDRVQCAYCQGGLYNWEDGDNPFGEHKKHFPACPFVQSMNGSHMEDINTSCVITRPREVSSLVQSGKSHDDVSRSIAMSLGFSSDDVDVAIRELHTKNVNISAATLVSTIHDLEDTAQAELSKQEKSISSVEQSDNSEDNTIATGNKSYSNDELLKVQSENKRLKDVTRCKIYLENDVMTLFLPCRHLCCCESCSKSVKNCPMCRSKIAATIKTFLC